MDLFTKSNQLLNVINKEQYDTWVKNEEKMAAMTKDKEKEDYKRSLGDKAHMPP